MVSRPTLTASELDTPLTIFVPVVQDDGFSSGVQDAPNLYAKAHAKRRNLPISQRITSEQQGSALPEVFVVRRSLLLAGIKPGFTIEAPDGAYRVTAVRDDPYYGRNVAIEISAIGAQ